MLMLMCLVAKVKLPTDNFGNSKLVFDIKMRIYLYYIEDFVDKYKQQENKVR